MMDIPKRQIRALYDEDSITVYQAYGPAIAIPAAAGNRFGPSFKRSRMTWIKPSFRWMMYRCGWATKPGQEHVLAIRIDRAGFEWALEHSAFAHFDASLHASSEAWRATLREPVRVQWDPELDLRFAPLAHRSLQIGLSAEAVARYVTNGSGRFATSPTWPGSVTPSCASRVLTPPRSCRRPSARIGRRRSPHASDGNRPVERALHLTWTRTAAADTLGRGGARTGGMGSWR